MKLNLATFEKCFAIEYNPAVNAALEDRKQYETLKRQLGKSFNLLGCFTFSDDPVDSHSNDSLGELAEKCNVETQRSVY